MLKFTRYSRILLLPMVFLLPLWLTFGLNLLGIGGWTSLFYWFAGVPALFVVLLILYALVKPRSATNGKSHLGIIDSVLLTAIYVVVFLHGFFLVDGGDTEASINSVATKFFGKSDESIFYSNYLSQIFLVISALLIIITLAVVIYERLRQPLP